MVTHARQIAAQPSASHRERDVRAAEGNADLQRSR
jgi:hypothetical protein